MQTKEAMEFLTAITSSGKAQQIVNAMLNGSCAAAPDGTMGEDMFRAQKYRDMIDTLLKSDDFQHMAEGLTYGTRHAYRLHGVKLMPIVAALFVGGFIAGVQFALDGGKAEHTHTHDPGPAKPPKDQLVN